MKPRLLLLLGPLFAGTSMGPPPLRPDAAIRLAPVALDPSDPARGGVGRLRFAGGWELTSDNRDFGGFSALAVRGTRVILLSDNGFVAGFDLIGGRAVDPRLWPLPGTAGAAKRQRDSESLSIDAASGRAWIGLEYVHQVRRYDAGLAHEDARAAPPAMARWPANGGSEALVRLRDGRFLILSERGGSSRSEQEALLFDGDPTDPARQPVRFRYRPPGGFVPTDAAELPDGRVAVLNRRFALWDGVAAAVTIIDPAAIAPDAIVGGTEIARLAPPLTVDNMEGLAVTRERGATILWIASDDNYSGLQRTLLMKFVLVERGGPRPTARP